MVGSYFPDEAADYIFELEKEPDKSLKFVSAIFHYFEKNNVFPGYFEWNNLKRNLIYRCFIYPLFHEHLFSPRLPRATRLHETSCFKNQLYV